MKKLLVLLLSVLTICAAAFAGCTGADRNTTSVQTDTATAVADDNPVEPPAETEPDPEPIPVPEPDPDNKDCKRCKRRGRRNALEIIIKFPKLHIYDVIRDENGISFKPFPKPEEPEEDNAEENN